MCEISRFCRIFSSINMLMIYLSMSKKTFSIFWQMKLNQYLKNEYSVAIVFVSKLVEMDKWWMSYIKPWLQKKPQTDFKCKGNKKRKEVHILLECTHKRSDCPRSEERPSYHAVHGNVNALSPHLFTAKSPNVRQMHGYVEKERAHVKNYFPTTLRGCNLKLLAWLANAAHLEFNCSTDSQSVIWFGFGCFCFLFFSFHWKLIPRK